MFTRRDEVLEGFLSKNADKVLKSSREVIRAVITNREMIESLVEDLDKIEEATRGLNYGGLLLPNRRFVDKALMIIRGSKENRCLCDFAFEDVGQSVKSLERNYGFILLSEETKGYINAGKIECPKCNQRYVVEEEDTGWHATSSRHWKIDNE